MSDQLIAFIMALLLAVIPNLIIKYRSQSEESKLNVETKDLNVATLQRVIEELTKYSLYLETKVKKKNDEIDGLNAELESCEEAIRNLKKKQEE